MIVTRRRQFSIFNFSKGASYHSILDEDSDSSARSSNEPLWYDPVNDDDSQDPIAASKHYSKKRSCLGLTVRTPNTSRFAKNFHSRVLQKFPFLIEMFYWIITYLFYRMTKVVSSALFSKTGIWDVAQDNGLRVLDFEQNGLLSFLFPLREHDVQNWFMNGHQDALTILNRFYALVHIPGTVGYVNFRHNLLLLMLMLLDSSRGTTTSPRPTQHSQPSAELSPSPTSSPSSPSPSTLACRRVSYPKNTASSIPSATTTRNRFG